MAVFKGSETPYAQAQKANELIFTEARINPGIEHYITIASNQSALLHCIASVLRSSDVYDSDKITILKEITKEII